MYILLQTPQSFLYIDTSSELLHQVHFIKYYHILLFGAPINLSKKLPIAKNYFIGGVGALMTISSNTSLFKLFTFIFVLIGIFKRLPLA